MCCICFFFFFSSRRRHTRLQGDWSSDVCSSDLAAVAKMLLGAGGEVRGQRVLIVAGTGPVGVRAAGLFARAGADVVITSRKADAGERARDLVLKRFGGTVRAIAMPDA